MGFGDDSEDDSSDDFVSSVHVKGVGMVRMKPSGDWRKDEQARMKLQRNVEAGCKPFENLPAGWMLDPEDETLKRVRAPRPRDTKQKPRCNLERTRSTKRRQGWVLKPEDTTLKPARQEAEKKERERARQEAEKKERERARQEAEKKQRERARQEAEKEQRERARQKAEKKQRERARQEAQKEQRERARQEAEKKQREHARQEAQKEHRERVREAERKQRERTRQEAEKKQREQREEQSPARDTTSGKWVLEPDSDYEGWMLEPEDATLKRAPATHVWHTKRPQAPRARKKTRRKPRRNLKRARAPEMFTFEQ